MPENSPTAPLTPVVGAVEKFLAEVVPHLTAEPPRSERRGRPAVLPNLCLWSGLLVCVLRGFSTQLSLWRWLHWAKLWNYPRFPVSDAAVYKRLERSGTAPLERLFEQISQLLADRLAPYQNVKLAAFAKAVVALDETTLDQVARTLPILRGVAKGDDRLLPGKLSGLFDLRRQQWLKIAYQAEPRQNEKVAARSMLQNLAPGSLILADLGYFGFEWFDQLTAWGYFWVTKLRAKTSYTVIHTYYKDKNSDTLDQLVWLGAYRPDQAAFAVRLVQFRVKGTLYRYLTNVLAPAKLPIIEVARLYARRWDIELAFKTLKVHLNLHLLWSAKTLVILQQVWATLSIAQIVQALQMEIAGRAEVDVFEVSLALLIQYLPQFAYTGQDPVGEFVQYGRPLRFIRPSSRTLINAPEPDLASYLPLPPNLVLVRDPRYAHKT
jgi:Transposase DDE domain